MGQAWVTSRPTPKLPGSDQDHNMTAKLDAISTVDRKHLSPAGLIEVRGDSRIPEIKQSCQSAIRLLNELIADVPDNTTYRLWLARAYRAESDLGHSSRDKNLTTASLQLAVTGTGTTDNRAPRIFPSCNTNWRTCCVCPCPQTQIQQIQRPMPSPSRMWNERSICAKTLPPLIPTVRNTSPCWGRPSADWLVCDWSPEMLNRPPNCGTTHCTCSVRLAERFPAVTIYQIACAQSLQQLAEAEHRTGLDSLARDHLDEAIAVVQQTELPEDVARFMDRFADRLQKRRTDISDK